MNALIEKLTGMDKMSDQVIATDFLVSTKSGVQNYAVAITETLSPQLKNTLINQLNDMIASHEAISDYMMKKGYYHAYDLQEQYKVDRNATDTALSLKDFIH
ncbi:spore coat protein [Anaerocolumna sedimenticola]|uniref:Spore coat protein n=1 Tax=Anaerocolumna sedimenticola TaxID=2696063 RepID=A0A6P1TK41_9FIRM|nr:spore coat protein [Anaerocolumna sedimenticola]QHQ61570.1 spore coat protein [Anaerocolumna sedimenticola]